MLQTIITSTVDIHSIFNKIILVTTLTNFPCIKCTIIHTIYNNAKLNLENKIIIPIFESFKNNKDMESKVAQVRGELISEIQGFVKCKGIFDTEYKWYEIPTYKGQDGLSIIYNTEDVYCVRVASVPAKVLGTPAHEDASVARVVIETNEQSYYAEDIYADDLEAILNYIKRMTDNDFHECSKWYNEYNGEY